MRRRREAAGVTMGQEARRRGVSVVQVSDEERGKRSPPRETLEALVGCSGGGAGDLVGYVIVDRDLALLSTGISRHTSLGALERACGVLNDPAAADPRAPYRVAEVRWVGDPAALRVR